MMLGGVAQTVYGLEKKRVFLGQKFNRSITKCNPNAFIKSKSLFSTLLSYPASVVQDAGFQEHFKRVIQQNQDCINSTVIPGSIEMFDAQNQRIDRLLQ